MTACWRLAHRERDRKTFSIWNLATGNEERRLELGENLSGLALSPGGRRILVGYDAPQIVRLIDLPGGEELHRFDLATSPRGLSFSPDESYAASGSHRGMIYLWKLESKPDSP